MKMLSGGGSLYGASLLLPLAVAAGPVTTVPWNGHPGAATFTFDDGCASQLKNVVPALKTRGIHATFFLYNVGNAFVGKKSEWIAVAQAGNELGNHTLDHSDLSKATNAATEVDSMASLLRHADPKIHAVTLAYPGCAVGSEGAVGAQSFIARGCVFGSGPYSPLRWKSPPQDWMNVGAVYVDDDTKATGPVLAALDAARNNGGWFSTLNHGVGGDWISVTPTNVAGMFDRAIKDSLWIGTFEEVGAYWRASLAMDTVSASGSGPVWELAWKCPHPKMPPSVKLKVRLASTVFGSAVDVSQNGVAIPANADGSYTIEFMSLKLRVAKANATGLDGNRGQGRIRARVEGLSVTFSGLSSESYRIALYSASGTLLSQGMSHPSLGEATISLPSLAHGQRVFAVLKRAEKDERVVPILIP